MVATLLFRSYSSVTSKLGCVNQQHWSVPLNRVSCTITTENKHGKDIGVRRCFNAGHYNAPRQFSILLCEWFRKYYSVPKDVMERTEVYEHAMSLTSGIGKSHFQPFKYLYALKLAEVGLSDQALDYCEGIARTVFTMPRHVSSVLIGKVKQLSNDLLQKKAEKTERLLKLCRLLTAVHASCTNVSVDQEQSSSSQEFQEELGSRHTLGELLGKGIFSTVYAEVHKADGRPKTSFKCEDFTFQAEKGPDENVQFHGPLMSDKMQKDNLIGLIQGKRQECFQQLNDPDQQIFYFFWLIMELFYKGNGRVMMDEIGAVILKGYVLVRRKLGGVRDLEDWCIPLVGLLCSTATEDEKRKAVVKMGDDFVSRGQTNAGHICYVVAQMGLGSRQTFDLIGCNLFHKYNSVPKDVMERTEVYEHAMSLTSGIGQPHFQPFKYLYALKLAEDGRSDQALDYCEGIARTVFTMPRHVSSLLIESVIQLSMELLKKNEKETEWLPKLGRLLKAVHDPSPKVSVEKPRSSQEFQEELDSRYTVGELLGKGTHSAVYAGVRKADGRPVALKYLTKNVSESFPGTKPREVELLEMVSKPPRCKNVVELLEWLDVSTSFVLVFERPSPCMDLQTFLRMSKNNRLSEDVAREIMRQLIQAVSDCIDHGVFHGDLHSKNILVNTDTLEVKLTDFSYGNFVSNFSKMGYASCFRNLGLILVELISGDVHIDYSDEIIKKCSQVVSPECCQVISMCLTNTVNAPSFSEILNHSWFKETRSSHTQV